MELVPKFQTKTEVFFMEIQKILEELRKSNIKKVESLTGIPADRMYKWLQGKGNPKGDDHQVLSQFFSGILIKEPIVPYASGIVRRTSGRKKSEGLIPYYDADFAAGEAEFYSDNRQIAPSYYMDVPEFSGCTAFRAYSDSMESLIKSGNILFGVKLEDWQSHLEYGQIYGIIMKDNRRYLKYIRRSSNPAMHFLLKSENPNYDDFEIPKEMIKSIWLVEGWLNRRT